MIPYDEGVRFAPTVDDDERQRRLDKLARFGQNRAKPGRAPGSIPNTTRQKREILDKIFGAPDTKERDDMMMCLRAQVMSGEMAPAVLVFLLTHLLGKPKERLELTGELGVTKIVREIVDPQPEVFDVTPGNVKDAGDVH